MPIPSFNKYGLLPFGTFDASKEEIEERYCANPNRQEIWQKFLEFCSKELLPMGLSRIVFVDGGFTSNKPHTKDIDIVLDVSTAEMSTVFQVFLWQSAHHDRIKEQYSTDFWVYHPSFPQDLRSFFQYIKEAERIERGAPLGEKKGLLRVIL